MALKYTNYKVHVILEVNSNFVDKYLLTFMPEVFF